MTRDQKGLPMVSKKTSVRETKKDLLKIIEIQEKFIDHIKQEHESFANAVYQLAKNHVEEIEHFNNQFDIFERNQKIYEQNQQTLIKQCNGIVRWAWKAEELGIDSKSDLVRFTATEKLEFKNDYEVDISDERLESGNYKQKLTLRKIKHEQK